MAINQLKAGALLSYVSIGLNNIIGLVYTPILLRMLGQNEYGLYSLVSSVVAYLTVLDLGFGNAIIRYTAKFRAENKKEEQYEMFGMFFLLYCIIGIIALAIGIILYLNVNSLFDSTMTIEDLSKVKVMLLLMVFNIAFTFPMSIWGAIISAYENFVFQKLVNIIRIILNPIVMIILLYMGYKAIAMVVVTTIFNVLTLCLNAFYCKYKIHIKIIFRKFNWSFLKEIAIYSFWIFLNAIMDRIYWSTGQFVLGIFSGAIAIAIYAVAIQLVHIYISFSTAISGVFLPKITNMITKGGNSKEISDIFIKTGRIQNIIMEFILIGFILFGKPFIIYWAGPEYQSAYYITLIFFIPLSIPLIQNLGITILQARNQMKFRSILYVIIAIISLIISIPLAKLYGGIGCAIGTSLAIVAGQIVAMNIYYYKKIQINIPLFWKEIIKMSVMPVILCIICYILIKHYTIHNINELILSIVIFSIIYIPIIWVTSMNKYERALFLSPLKKLLRK